MFDSNNEIKETFITVLKGDVTGDGKVKAYDALQILKGVMKKTELDEVNTLIRDYDEDGEVKMYDAIQYLRASLRN